jgi:hypothetical protein
LMIHAPCSDSFCSMPVVAASAIIVKSKLVKWVRAQRR